jgi:hypothetical protein
MCKFHIKFELAERFMIKTNNLILFDHVTLKPLKGRRDNQWSRSSASLGNRKLPNLKLIFWLKGSTDYSTPILKISNKIIGKGD